MEAAHIMDEKIPADIHTRKWATIEYGTDDANHAEFFWSIKKSYFQADGLFRPNPTDLEGKIGERILMVTIFSSRRQTATHRATAEHKKRFPRQYAAFMAGEDQKGAAGTSLEVLPFLDASWIEQLNHFRVYSVEQLLAVDDGRRAEFPRGFLEIQKRAKDHMDIVNKNAPVAALEKKNALLEEQNAEQKEQLNQMASRLSALESVLKPTPRRGRPPKGVSDGASA